MDGRLYDHNQQHFGSDPKSWVAGGDDLSHTLSSLSAAAATASAAGTVDRALFNDLVEMVPLVQSLIDQKPNSSFTRRGSMIYTKKPSRDSLLKKSAGKSPSLSTKKNRDQGDKDQIRTQDGYAEESISSSKNSLSEKHREELMALSEQVEDLKRQLSEKDELLKSEELAKSELAMRFDELNNEATEKDSQIKSLQLQLSEAKIKLADKQAAVEKLQWEATTSSRKVEKLQEDLDKMGGDISAFMILIQGLANNDSPISGEDYDVVPYSFDQNHELDDEMHVQSLEAVREAYIAAVATAKEKQDDISISAAGDARRRLQSIVLKQI